MAREEEEPNWIIPYNNFLIQGVLPPNKDEARCLKQKASYYIILNGELFKRGLTTLYSILPPKVIGYKTPRKLGQRRKRRP